MEVLSLVSSITVGIFVLSFVIVYYLRSIAPYLQFPSYRLDIRIFYWIFKRQSVSLNLFKTLMDVGKRYEKEGMCVIWNFEPWVLVYGEEAVRKFMSGPEAIDHPKFYDVFKIFLGNAIFMCNGERWKKMKKILHPAFQASIVKDKVPIFNEHAAELVNKLSEYKNKTTVDAIDHLKDSVFGAFYESSLGIGKKSDVVMQEKSKQTLKMINTISQFIIRRILTPWLKPDISLYVFPSGRKSMKIFKEVNDLSMKMLEEMKKSVSDKPVSEIHNQKSKLIVEILIEQHLKDPSFTMKDLLDQTNHLIIAGYETTSYTLLWCLFMLGNHQDVQEKVYQEVMEAPPGNLSYEDVRQLELLDCVIKETLRLYPLGPIIGRRLNKAVQCGKYTVPKGASLLIFAHLLHRNAEIYPDPEKFDPERFRAKDSRINGLNHIPFSEGTRPCPGETYSMVNMKIILAHIVRKFNVVAVDRREDVELAWNVMLLPAKPIRMQFISRNHLGVD